MLVCALTSSQLCTRLSLSGKEISVFCSEVSLTLTVRSLVLTGSSELEVFTPCTCWAEHTSPLSPRQTQTEASVS